MTAPNEKIFENSIGATVLYAKSTVDDSLVAVKINPATGAIQADITGAATHDGQDELKALIGEKQDTPTSNTLLARLKDAVTHLATIAGAISAPATTPTMDSITIAVINTEYSKALPANCKRFSFRSADVTDPDVPVAGNDVRYSFETGKVATPVLPYGLLEGGAVYSESGLLLTTKTLYVAGTTAGNIVLLEMWS
jgi:hypothetical protein